MTYRELAQKAIEQERRCCFGAAAQFWIAANKVAQKKENQEWAAKRAIYCSRRHSRPALTEAA
ncbi:ANR family transcriptional regulator [Pseudescherichia sp.]|uniref:ANR family transcriptional regulator n=1 Tax=Pseudescherichia sp. TaxID=2055881 RepID=UPI0028AFF61F|nr:ANR family transcriptional regulator [Pseudescherichia sp.]